MSVEIGIWRIDGTPERVPFTSLQAEKKLEDVLHADLSILDPGLLIVGRQVPTAYGKFIDLLAIDADGDLVVIELKRDRTPREVVAQVLDYGSWVRSLGADSITELYSVQHHGSPLAAAFVAQFGTELPERLNTGHRLVVVASSLDPETERIIGYLTDDYGVPINAVFFRCFRVGEAEFLARTWLIDPAEAEEHSAKAPASKKVQGSWNGVDFFVNVGEGSIHRSWDDARQFGFVAAGQSRWASSRLDLLAPGKRVFACISKLGYVGVGIVTGGAVPVKDFKVTGPDGVARPLLDQSLVAPGMGENAADPDLSEYVVPVRWLVARPTTEAYWEPGMFANQNPACRLRDSATLAKLVAHFGVSADGSEVPDDVLDTSAAKVGSPAMFAG
ncbi:MAG: endonuclease NucS [Acidobacteriota bacterium]|nr:endonuclease NucS [Acidobacteriota bacterium]